ncbi:MAG TPA: EAL domain-containing protein, partial [Acidimicrobiales bacterium]|nr:EAL domain-containing protein [Acidimicrobiales bacterium]
AEGIRAVLSGDVDHFVRDYAFPTDRQQRWFTVRVSSTNDVGGGAVISHLDLTALKETERRIRGDHCGISTLFDESAPIFALLDADGTARYVSPSAAELFPPVDGAFGPTSLLAGLEPGQRQQAEQCLQRAGQRTGSREQLVIDVCDTAKRWHTLDLTVCNLLDDPSVAAVVLTGSDITTVHRRKVTRHLETHLLRRLPAAVVVTDQRGTIVYWNDRASELYGHRADEVLGTHIDELGVWPVWADGSEPGPWAGDHVARGRDGAALPVHATLQRVEDPETGFSGVVGTSIDITERRLLEERLDFEARHDPLTGLLNRRALVDHLDGAIARAGRRGGGVAVLYIDLDNFKVVNDNLNHQAGDEVLKAVSALVESALGPGDVLARLGGDEFVVCAEGCASIDDAVALADRVIAVLRVPFRHHGLGVVIGASVGVTFSSDQSLAEELMRDADIAMYEAKEGGKGRTVAFDETLRNQLRRTRVVTAQLGAALDTERIVTYFQPEVDMDTGALLGFEALVRWDDPGRGLVPPAEFVPLAEESELINRLGTTVLRDACRALRHWNLRPGASRLKVAVNVSARQLHAPDFAAEVLDIIGAAGVSPRQVCVEITESTVADNDMAAAVLGVLRAAGVAIAIDDFGTGFSSLHRLQRLPIDDLKIDRTFVSQMLDDNGSRVIVSAVVGLARSLGLGLVAEGVERESQARALRALGCRRAQGYLWSRPVDLVAATDMVDRQRWAPAPDGG